MFARILSVAIIAGGLAGLAVTGIQMLWSVPLIGAAEEYESAAAAQVSPERHPEAAAHVHAQPADHHAGEGWAPADGLERTFWTAAANVLLGIGGGLLIAGSFTLLRRVDLVTGLLWGSGAFLAFSLAPALGLPPELPGAARGDLYDRQIWWIGTAVATAAGLVLLAYGRPIVLRLLLAPALIILPHAIGSPQPSAPISIVPDELTQEFILAALVTSGVFWLLLGLLVALFTVRFNQRPAKRLRGLAQ